MDTKEKVFFKWQGGRYEGIIEKEYDNSVLIDVTDPNEELKEKYLGRIVISKKDIKRK